jgi:serine phosphatase RsbU (regulator of sigma subunit)
VALRATVNEDPSRPEAELPALLERNERLRAWLDFALGLPELAGGDPDLETACRRAGQRLRQALRLQRVRFFQRLLDPPRLSAIGEEPASEVELSAGASAVLAAARAGSCKGLEPAARELAAAVGLEHFLWLRIAVEGSPEILLVAGFERPQAGSFDDADAVYFAGTGRQLELLFGHITLVNELERRVEQRTSELVTANRGLEAAITALKSRDFRIAHDLEEARTFQSRILPKLPAGRDPEVVVVYRPLEQVGGDIYDVELLAPGHVRVFIADATGHGVQAAMRTILLKREYDRLKAAYADPAALLQALNARLVEVFPQGDIMCTAVCFDVITRPTPELVYSNAANPPLVVFSGSDVREVYTDGSFLGIENDVHIEAARYPLEPGAVVLACSDGMTEQLGRTGASFEAVLELQMLARPGDFREHIAELEREFDAFRGDVPLADDLTLVAVRLAQ